VVEFFACIGIALLIVISGAVPALGKRMTLYLGFEFRTDHMNDFASLHLGGGYVQLLEDRLKPFQAIVWNSGHDEAKFECAEVVLRFQPAVNRDEDVKPFLSKVEERAVLAGAPSGLGYALYSMARKRSFQSGGNALV
jgi:hypothetical protein